MSVRPSSAKKSFGQRSSGVPTWGQRLTYAWYSPSWLTTNPSTPRPHPSRNFVVRPGGSAAADPRHSAGTVMRRMLPFTHVVARRVPRHRRARGGEDVPLRMVSPPHDGSAARRDARGPTRRDRRPARAQRRGEDDVSLHSRHATHPRSGQRARAGIGRRARLARAATASQHGERAAVVPLEPPGRGDRGVLRTALRTVGFGIARARGPADRGVRADPVPAGALQRALHRSEAARGAGEVARQRSRAALPRRAYARTGP